MDENLTREIVFARANDANLGDLCKIVREANTGRQIMDVLFEAGVVAGGVRLIEVEDAQAMWQVLEGFRPSDALFSVDDLPAAADALEQIASYDLVGLDWEEPALAEASAKILAARTLLLEASNLIDDVRRSL